MAGSFNKVFLLGNVGKEPEVRTFEGDKKVAQFTLATTTGYGEKAVTEWHNIVAWDKLADMVDRFVKKGSHIFVEGAIRTRSYEKDGSKRYVTEIMAHNINLDDLQPAQAPAASAPAPQPQGRAKTSRPAYEENNDLPF